MSARAFFLLESACVPVFTEAWKTQAGICLWVEWDNTLKCFNGYFCNGIIFRKSDHLTKFWMKLKLFFTKCLRVPMNILISA